MKAFGGDAPGTRASLAEPIFRGGTKEMKFPLLPPPPRAGEEIKINGLHSVSFASSW